MEVLVHAPAAAVPYLLSLPVPLVAFDGSGLWLQVGPCFEKEAPWAKLVPLSEMP